MITTSVKWNNMAHRDDINKRQVEVEYNMAHRDDINKRQVEVEYNMAHQDDHNKCQSKYNRAQRRTNYQRTTEDETTNELESFI
jgi:hypothetical protein